jgi:GTP diphosphokinase / guanosine-3',5'-bis(diphosphate) 3'-diphosphatase
MLYKDRKLGTQQSTAQQKTWFGSLIPSLFIPFVFKQSNKEKAAKIAASTQSHKERMPKWIQEIGESHKHAAEAKEFVEDLRQDFFTNRIFVFTPEGDVVDLPVDACPIDFAYAIHSEIGDHIGGAKVNNKFVGLDTKLKNGDIVEIIKKEKSYPTQKWLEFVKTSLARRRIKAYLATRKAHQL